MGRIRVARPNIAGSHPQLPSTPGAPEHGLGLAWDNPASAFVWASMGGGGAPANAQYLTLALDGTLTAERRFDPGIGLVAVDGGAGADYDLRFGFAAEANGDLPARSGGAWGRLPVGSEGDVLTVVGGLPVWAALALIAWVLAPGFLGDLVVCPGASVFVGSTWA